MENNQPTIENSISEKFSEKRKRGRPRAFEPWFEEFVDKFQLTKKTDTERSNLNKKYFQTAFGVLLNAPNPERFAYLLPPKDEIIAGTKKIPRHTIVAELGHLDDDDILEWAEIICEEKWPTKEAIHRLRSWRLGRNPVPCGDRESLALHLGRAIDCYWSIHSADDWQQITRAALEIVTIAHQEEKEDDND